MGGNFLLLLYWMTQDSAAADPPDPTCRFTSTTGGTGLLSASSATGRVSATTGATGSTSSTTTC